MTYYLSDHADGAAEPGVRKLRWTAQYQSKAKVTPRSRAGRIVRRNLDLLTNSGTVFATTVITSALGFVYWWLAARYLTQGQVGVTSSAVATMTLVSTIGVFGLGTLLVGEVQRTRAGTEWNLISAAASIAATASAVGGMIFVVASVFLPSLVGGHGTIAFSVLLILGCGLTAVQSVVDDALVGLLAARLQLLRNSYMALIKLGLLAVVAFVPSMRSAAGLLGTWVFGLAVSFLALAVHLRRASLLSSLRPRLSLLQGKWRHAFGHNVLNLSLFLPRAALPLLVTALVSAHATAGFYTAWMIFMFLAMVPMSLSNMLYAITATDRAALQSKIRFSLLASAVIGLPAVAVLMLAARPIMGIFGPAYQEAGVLLGWLALTFPATVMRSVYFAAARVRRRLRLATAFSVVAGLAELAGATIGAKMAGVSGLTKGYAFVTIAEAVILLPRVLSLAGIQLRRAKTAETHTAAGSQLAALADLLDDEDETPDIPGQRPPILVNDLVMAHAPTEQFLAIREEPAYRGATA